jgi:putative sigma-54 modulation protein
MDILVSGRNLNVTEELQDYVEKKVARLERYMQNIGEVRVDLAEVNAANAEERYVAQVTVRNERGKVMRSEERSVDIMAAVDATVDKLSRQVERYKGKGKRRRRGKGLSAEEQIEAYEAELEAESDLDAEYDILRRKRFSVVPMHANEAIEQLEMLDHDFFLYYNPDTATINVVYRRKDGGYGVLEPELS